MYTRILALLLLITILAFPVALPSYTASASSSSSILLVDLYASSRSNNSADLAKSASAIVASLNPVQRLAIGTIGPTTEFTSFIENDSTQIKQTVNQLYSKIDLYADNPAGDLFNSLSQTFQLLISDSASSDSQVYLISAEPATPLTSEQLDQITTLLARFKAKSWRVNIVSLQFPTSGIRTLQSFANSGGGIYLVASYPTGLKTLTNSLLQSAGEGPLVTVSSNNATTNQSSSYNIPVAPRTKATSFVFLKDASSTAGTVVNPSGDEVSDTDTSTVVMEAPFVSIVRLANPSSGDWQIKLPSSTGNVSAWYSILNPIQLVPESVGPFPKDEPTIITASIREGSTRLALTDVEYFAEMTTPSGKKAVFTLNDLGLDGDKSAGDGLYSVRIPPLTESGSYGVSLQLQWPNFSGKVSATSQFRVEPFPTANIELLPADGLEIGKQARIASITVNVDGQPYPITPDQITASVTAFDGTTLPVQIEAKQLFGEGRAWSYYATIVPEKGGQQSLNFSLKVNYFGRDYVYSAKPLLLSVPSQPAPQPEKKPYLPFSVWVLVVIPLGALAFLASVSWLLSTKPYGYLYDDKGNELARFRQIRRNPIMALLFKSSLYGSEIGVQALEAAIFRFSKNGVELLHRSGGATVRVDNEPVTNRVSLPESSWIGSQGKLYIYTTEPHLKPASAAPLKDQA